MNDHKDNDILFEGYWFCSNYLGSFSGPIISGIIVTQLGFRVATALGFGLYCFMNILNFSTAPTSKKNRVDIDNGIRNGDDSGVDQCIYRNLESKEILHWLSALENICWWSLLTKMNLQILVFYFFEVLLSINTKNHYLYI